MADILGNYRQNWSEIQNLNTDMVVPQIGSSAAPKSSFLPDVSISKPEANPLFGSNGLFGSEQAAGDIKSLSQGYSTPGAQNAASGGFLNMFSTSQGYDLQNPTWSNHLFGGTDKFGNKHSGIGGGLLDIGKTGMGVWLGLKQLGLAEDSLDFQKDAFSKQFTNQAKLTNAQLRDRQIRRNRENSWSTPTDEYMKQNAVSLG
jgi:hypothetical protein